MTSPSTTHTAGASLERRALSSGGTSHDAIYRAVAEALDTTGASGTVADVGCGSGAMRPFTRKRFSRYIGVDAIRFAGLSPPVPLVRADLDGPIPLGDAIADAAIAVETIEHLENPRAFLRELARITRPGGWVIVSTPNQLSAMSIATLLARQRFAAFQDVHYPAHRSALLEVDLRRIAAEAGLDTVHVQYNLAGRMPLTSRHYPRAVARLAPRLFSDTVILSARKPLRP